MVLVVVSGWQNGSCRRVLVFGFSFSVILIIVYVHVDLQYWSGLGNFLWVYVVGG